ncbi:MAG TPA: ParB/RepB/Spo0J family partition protein [Anaerolineaceae bacterium]|nr:ParB/RepB/Spo0J family partition protein [Anaerolineaceae bacterium]
MRKGGLGKGLDALIPSGLPPQTEGNATLVPVDQIVPNPRQPRHTIENDSLKELADSIREHGILQPLIVSMDADNGAYTLVAGERRWRAAKLAKMETVPVLVRQVTEQQLIELALIENLQRTDLMPLETAEAYHNLSEDFGMTHEEIAARVGKSRVAVTNTIRLLNLPEKIRQTLAEQRISEGHARALLALNSTVAQLSVLHTILEKDLTVRQTEELIRHLSGTRPAPHPPKPVEPEIEALEERLRTILGTRVTLRHGKRGGSLTIHYYSDEELNALVAQILKE